MNRSAAKLRFRGLAGPTLFAMWDVPNAREISEGQVHIGRHLFVLTDSWWINKSVSTVFKTIEVIRHQSHNSEVGQVSALFAMWDLLTAKELR